MEIDKFILKGQSINIVDKKSQQTAQNAVAAATAAKNTANSANTKSDTALKQIVDLRAEISDVSESTESAVDLSNEALKGVAGNKAKIDAINNYNISFANETINFTKIGGIKK